MIWIAGVAAVCFGVCLPLLMYYKKKLRYHLSAAFKSTGTLCLLLLSLTAAIKLDPRCYVCTAAMLLYAIADYALEFQFMIGAGFFLCGHICSIAFFLNLVPVSAVHLICLVLFGGLMAFVFYRWRKPIGKQMPAFSVYGTSLVLMVVSAMGCFTLNNLSGILFACGGALFFFSDFVLLRRILFPSGDLSNWVIMFTYYGSLLLFGIGCLYLH